MIIGFVVCATLTLAMIAFCSTTDGSIAQLLVRLACFILTVWGFVLFIVFIIQTVQLPDGMRWL